MSSGLVPIFSWKTRKNSTNGNMGNKKLAKKNFCYTPSARIFSTNIAKAIGINFTLSFIHHCAKITKTNVLFLKQKHI